MTVIVQGKLLDEYVKENKEELEAADLKRTEALQRRRRSNLGSHTSSASPTMYGGGNINRATPRSLKHKGF